MIETKIIVGDLMIDFLKFKECFLHIIIYKIFK